MAKTASKERFYNHPVIWGSTLAILSFVAGIQVQQYLSAQKPVVATEQIMDYAGTFSFTTTPGTLMIDGVLDKSLANKKDQLWVFTIAKGTDEYWPLEYLTQHKPREWHLGKTVKTKSGDKKSYQLYVVGEEGQTLIRAYRGIMEELHKNGAPWEVGLRWKTSDMYKCGEELYEITY